MNVSDELQGVRLGINKRYYRIELNILKRANLHLKYSISCFTIPRLSVGINEVTFSVYRFESGSMYKDSHNLLTNNCSKLLVYNFN